MSGPADAETRALAALALGRILRLASRPEQPGDGVEYERCRALIMDALCDGSPPDWTPNWARDQLRGAAGD